MSTYHEFVIEITPPVRPKRQKMTNSTDPSGLERSQHLEEEEEELAAIEPSLIFECELCLFITSAENDLWEHRYKKYISTNYFGKRDDYLLDIPF